MVKSSQVVIRCADLHKIYKSGDVEVHALRGVDVEIYRGDFVMLMGASGSGKSTLMNLLGCLDRPTKGKYYFRDQDVSNLDRNKLAAIRNDRIGFVFQGFNLLSRTSALDNVMLPLMYNAKVKAKERTKRATMLLEKFGLGGRLDHTPNKLSGGQQQRVAIARALVNNPEIILADEPTGNLDTKTGLEILAEFQRLNNEAGQTIVMVTHDRDIARCGKRQIFMQDGRIISDGPTPDFRDAAEELKKLLATRHPELDVPVEQEANA